MWPVSMQIWPWRKKQRGERIAILSGGELTVTVKGSGKGGPSQEYALALAIALEGADGIYALAGDSRWL